MAYAILRLTASSKGPRPFPLTWDACFRDLAINSRNVDLDSGVMLDIEKDMILSSAIYEDSLLQMIDSDTQPSNQLQLELYEEPLVYYPCYNDLALNSDRVELDSALTLDVNFDIIY